MVMSEGERFIIYLSVGILYAMQGYGTKLMDPEEDVELKLPMAIKTIFIGVVAGLLMSTWGADASHEAYIAAAAVAVPIVDNLYNTFVPESLGGSA